ncbi:hypothetical protein [Mesorhizobium sp. 10J20-29]
MSWRWTILSTAIALFFAPIQAGSQEWQRFGVRALGFTFEVPPGFILKETTDNGTRATFEAANEALLTVWGGVYDGLPFEAMVRDRLEADKRAGWDVTYRRITSTWASYSGIKGGRIAYVRAIKLCDDQFAIFKLSYATEEKLPYDPIVVRMVKSLTADRC